MSTVARTINYNQKLPKNLANYEYDNNFGVKKERIAMIIAFFEGVIKDLDGIPLDACFLTCALYKPSIYTFQLINEYHSTKKVLLTFKNNGNDLKILTKQDARKIHADFSDIDLKNPGSFEFQCEQKTMENEHLSKKLSSVQHDLKTIQAYIDLVSACFY